MKSFHSIQKDYSGTRAVFEIELQNHENVYMSVYRTNHLNEERYVVVVSADKFIQLWRNEPSDISNGNIETWENDRKYHYAEQGFSHGIKNPVPVANVVCHGHADEIPVYQRKYLIFKELVRVEKYVINFVAFTNGITRTIWLLVHGAKYFPVECSIKEGAGRLAKIAGYSGNEYRTVEQLTTNI